MNKENIDAGFANIFHNKNALSKKDTLQPIQFVLQY